ncbi:hypothetical protein BHE74_00003036 [Ensete ventricosum]|nr:hypothetical protein GW17_00014362 [Ensete ventricosum]RWW88098.1 hypothetical protein BHE74_00003036 [Ensete ventricosum]
MPTVRYQIRNEYGLADPELHRAADKDDPEAILEGVAMAGLVGVLRQLGDLAEYVPLFFLASRGEWGSACASSCFLLSEWFDTAGAGACLKRYSDPSFFKMELVSSGLVETEMPREKKSRKMRVRYSETTVSDQVSSKSATRLVRLRCRNSNNADGSKGCNLRKCLLALHSDEQKVVLDNSRRLSSLNASLVDSGELTSVMHDAVMDVSANYPLVRDVSTTETPTKEVVKFTYKFDHWKTGTEEFSEALHGPLGDMQNPQRNFNFVENKEKFADAESKSESSNCDGELNGTEKTTSVQMVDHKLADVEHKLERNNGYKTEDGGSEQENFMDALNSMEPEVETDSENKDRLELGVTKKEAYDMNFYTSETLDELLTQFSKQDTAAVSIVSIGLNHNLESGISSNLCNLSETPATQEKEITSNSSENSEYLLGETNDESCEECFPHDEVANPFDMISDGASDLKSFDNPILRSEVREEPKDITSNSSENSEYLLGETNDESCEECLPHDEVANLFDMISDGASDIKSFDIPILRSEVREEPCNSCVINSTSNLISTGPQEGFDALQFVKSHQVGTSVDHEAQLGRDETIKCSDGRFIS